MRLEISQTQKQIISPVIMQTLELLQIPAIELTEKLEEEAEANPILELEYPQGKDTDSAGVDEEVENTFQDSSDNGYDAPSPKKNDFRDYNNKSYIENMSVETVNIYDHLMEQVQFLIFTPLEIEIAEIIITSLDDRGFLSMPPEALLMPEKFTAEEFESVRQRLLRAGGTGENCGQDDYSERTSIPERLEVHVDRSPLSSDKAIIRVIQAAVNSVVSN